jgi:hypothetical protein
MVANGKERSIIDLLAAWNWRAKRASLSQYETARRLDRRHYLLGILLVSCSVISTCLAGRALFGLSNVTLDSFMTVFSAATLTIACLHVFLQDAARAERYRRSGSRFAAIKREIEQALAWPNTNLSEPFLNSVRKQLDDLSGEALPIPDRVWKYVDRRLQSEKKSVPWPTVAEQKRLIDAP